MHDIFLAKEIRSDATGFQHLISIYHDIKACNDHDITLVFDNCCHFDANLSAMLGSLLDDLKANGYNLWLTTPVDQTIRDNLSRNKFFNAFNPNYKAQDTENFIEYTRFSPLQTGEFKAYIELQLMKKQKFPAHTESAGHLIQESIMEIFVNAVYHGQCNNVYSCGEYDERKNPPSLDMTIVDRGNTIPAKVNDFMTQRGWQPMKPCQAIRWALMDGTTTKDIPGGLGLFTLIEFLKLNQGAMQIVSGKGMVEYRNNRLRDFDIDKPFDGTIVNMEFNFNDNKNYRLVNEPIDMDNLL